MKWKKVMSGVLAGTLILTPVTPAVAAIEEIPVQQEESAGEASGEQHVQNTAVEEEQQEEQVQKEEALVLDEEGAKEEQVAAAMEDGLVASYNFEGENPLVNAVNQEESATALITGLSSYTETVVTEEGRTEESKALKLGDYGLKLNKANLGKNYTVSLWVKANQTLADNQSVLFLGYHNPEKWLSIAGTGTSNWKIWAKGTPYSWTELFKPQITSNEWHCLTITENEDTFSAYLDGELLGTKDSNGALDGENQDIYIGVNNWDPEFSGLADDVKVYNRELSVGEVYRLYDENTSVEDILNTKGISAIETMTLVLDETESIEVDMPAVVKEADPAVTYRSSDETVATVDENGVVTAVAKGTAVVTTSVTIGNTTKTAETNVTVNDSLNSLVYASYDFEENLKDGKNGTAATAITTGLGNYSGTVNYVDGHGDGKAVKLGDYGLKLNKQNLGTEYTVSLWLKPDGTLKANQAVLFLGYHSPEKWFGIAGEDGANKCKIWGNGGTYSTWTTLFSPTINSDRWYHVTFTGTKGKVTAYVDGVKLGTKDCNDPLDGENQDIYLGVNYWDPEFTGAMDGVKIYKKALTEAQVQAENKTEFEQILKGKLDQTITMNSILGENAAANEVKYDLDLPSELEGMSVTWSSTDACVAEEGTVTNPGEDKAVTLTAVVSTGTLTASAEYQVTVKAFEKEALNALIQKAKALDTTYCTEKSKTQLQEAISQAEAADTFSKAEEATKKLNKAIQNLCYLPEYVNPFDSITAPETMKAMKPEETAALLTIPEKIKDMVTVEYKSSDDTKAVYTDGTVTAKADGKVTVTAIVTAKYNSWKMEYSTALNISSPTSPTEPTTPSTPTETPAAGSVTLNPSAEVKGDGNVEINIPEVAKETTDVTVNLPEKSLADAVKNSKTDKVSVQVTLSESIADSKKLKELNLSKEVLQEVQKNGKELIVQVNGGTDGSYSWTIDSAEIDKVRLSDVNLVLCTQDAEQNNKIEEKLFADESGMLISLMQKGGLPGTFTITVDGTKYSFQEGDTVKLREYNETKDSLTTLEQSIKVGKDGTIAFQVSSGMSFLLTKTTPIPVDKIEDNKTASTSSSVKITWNAVDGADGYRVYRYNSRTKKYERIAEVAVNSYTDKNLTSASAVSYKVRAFVKASKYYYGAYTAPIKVMTDPTTPASVKVKRLTKVSTNTTAQISFEKSARANTYRIYRYNEKTKKYTVAYQVKNNKLYQYNSNTKKYTKVNNVSVKDGVITCTLKNLNLKKEKSQKYVVRAVVSKSGYISGISVASKSATVK